MLKSAINFDLQISKKRVNMNSLKFTVKLFATIVVLCLGLNLIAGELDGRWSIVSANIDGQEVQTAGQKCFEDSFFEVSGR